MTDDEEQIRRRIERWAEAVHGGDLSGVLADHSEMPSLGVARG